jgi:hypothetical protein
MKHRRKNDKVVLIIIRRGINVVLQVKDEVVGK